MSRELERSLLPLAGDDYGPQLARTLRLARRSLAKGNFPVGAMVLSRDGRVLGSGSNRSQSSRSPIAHAEMRAIGRAGTQLALEEPGSATLITSAEPCLMCLGAALSSPAVGTIVWAAGSAGSIGSALGAVRASGYNRQRVDTLRAVPEPNPTARRESRRLLHRWCVGRSDPRAAWYADGDQTDSP